MLIRGKEQSERARLNLDVAHTLIVSLALVSQSVDPVTPKHCIDHPLVIGACKSCPFVQVGSMRPSYVVELLPHEILM